MSHADSIRELISRPFFPIDPVEWKPETRFDAMQWDSLDMVEAVMAIEDKLHITIADSELEGVQTFGQLVEIVDKIAP